MALIPPAYLESVVGIGSPNSDKGIDWFATGFLFAHLRENAERQEDKKYGLYVVTNRHVFDKRDRVTLRLNPPGGVTAKDYTIDLMQASAPIWTAHPDPDVDVAVMTLNTQLLRNDGIDVQPFLSDAYCLTLERMKENGIMEGDGIFVLGFPMGMMIPERQYVILRHGVIARISDTYDARSKSFLVDANIYPGNSGGPVVTRPTVVSIQGTSAYGSAALIGMVSAFVPYEDVAISVQTKLPRVIFSENSGLGIIVPYDKIIETVMRERAERAAKPEPARDAQPQKEKPAG